MAILNVPERGQPLDVSTISQIVNAINTLSTSVTSSTYKYVTVDTQGAGKQSVKTSDAKIIGGYVDVTNNSSQNAGDEVSFSYPFSDFKFAPIVTATPVNVTNTPDNGNANAVGFTFLLVGDGTARTMTWNIGSTGISWAAGTAPTYTSTANKVDIYSFLSNNGGSNWYGFVGGQNF